MQDAMMYRLRRGKLWPALGDAGIALHNGTVKLRNGPGVPYRFRSSSSILHFAGPLPPGTVLYFDEEQTIAFLPAPSRDQVIWDGPPPNWSELADTRGFDEVRSLAELPLVFRKFDKRLVLSVPAPDADAQRELEQLLRRPVSLSGPDRVAVEAIVRARLIHDELGISEIRQAVAATERAFFKAAAVLRPGISENAVLAELAAEITRVGFEPSFDPIVTAHGEVLHQSLSDGVLVEGDLLLVDFGAESRLGLAADVTRTWPVSGGYTQAQRDIYQAVLDAQEAAIGLAAPGVEYRSLHDAACLELTKSLCAIGLLRGDPADLVARNVHALFFPHGIGHLIGIDVHDMEEFGDFAGYEPGRIRDPKFGAKFLRLSRPLEVDMVVSVEPGFYIIPSLIENRREVCDAADAINEDLLTAISKEVRGIRIEEDILITPNGADVLTAHIPRTVSEVEACLRGVV